MTAAFDKLRSKLAELFQLDAAAELDFGIYRILNARRVEVEGFLHSLEPQVEAILAEALQSGTSELKAELGKVEAGLRAGGFDEAMIATAPRVKELREKIATSGSDPTALTHDIFSHLTTFFSRYYKDGDFLSLRRYKRDTYAIPYEGEEVKLHWANADQYYIKSAENFRDYTFRLTPAEDAPRVTFKLVEADTQKDNTKAPAGQERRFVYQSVIESAGKTHLTLGFAYLPLGTEKKQSDLNRQAIQAILTDAAKGPFVALAAPDKTYTGKKKEGRTLLEKHLTDYTARNTFDYFIHKDLGGFLRREMDFYIKNEVLHLDDLDEAPETNWRETRARLKALRNLAGKVIRFLAQIEDFQKKLWLKKKFVTTCDYVVTLDRIPEALYPEIAACEAQREEWVSLLAIDEIKADLGRTGYSVPLTAGFLKENQALAVDTRLVGDHLRRKICDALLDGLAVPMNLVVNSDNCQALQSLNHALLRTVKAVYIDPPYNTGDDGFQYKDGFQHSTWLSCLTQVASAAAPLLTDDGVFVSSIDDTEFKNLWFALYQVFGSGNYLGSLVWKRRSASGMGTTPLSLDHEYMLVYARDRALASLHGLERTQADYPHFDKVKQQWYSSTDLTIGATREKRPNQFYPITNPRTGKQFEASPQRVWRFFPETMREVIANDMIIWPDEAEGNLERPRYRTYFDPNDSGGKPCSSWIETANTNDREIEADEAEYGLEILKCGMNQEGGRIVERLFGSKAFAYPKPVSLVRSFVRAATRGEDTVLDFFGGSGTTGHAVINLNREDGGNRKYILIEMGEHFDTVLVPRLKKVIYSKDWKDGKPKSRNTGVSHCFKVLRLESYEDTLNNLRLHRSRAQELALESMTSEAREEYQLGYMLDLEATGSQSLLNVAAFEDPFSYTLNIATGTAGETKPVTVDLVETFNWLLGVTVLAQGGRATPAKGGGVTWIEGTNPAGEKVLVLWRNTKEVDADALNAWCKKQKVSVLDGEFSLIYINGDHHLENLRRDDQTWKVRLIDEEFPKLMWEGCV
jgi:adenine-specific DNA-methyltransferase